jgi:hypothetical protein
MASVTFTIPLRVSISIGEPQVMPKAMPCKVCKTDRHLKWKTWYEDEWWIACEGCGNHSQPRGSTSQAGEQWNSENFVPASQSIVDARRKT